MKDRVRKDPTAALLLRVGCFGADPLIGQQIEDEKLKGLARAGLLAGWYQSCRQKLNRVRGLLTVKSRNRNTR